VVPAQAPAAASGGTAVGNGKVGNIRKCPACGAEVPAMTAVCPECKHEFSNVKVASSVQQFFEKLDAVDTAVFEKDSEKEAKGPLGGAMGAMFGLDRMVKMQSGTSAGEKRKIALIEGFPIPNGKEDIVEFIITASSRIKPLPGMMELMGRMAPPSERNSIKVLNDAWSAKLEQAYTKAKMSFGSDKTAIAQIEEIIGNVQGKSGGGASKGLAGMVRKFKK
jgi:hypothetical protein